MELSTFCLVSIVWHKYNHVGLTTSSNLILFILTHLAHFFSSNTIYEHKLSDTIIVHKFVKSYNLDSHSQVLKTRSIFKSDWTNLHILHKFKNRIASSTKNILIGSVPNYGPDPTRLIKNHITESQRERLLFFSLSHLQAKLTGERAAPSPSPPSSSAEDRRFFDLNYHIHKTLQQLQLSMAMMSAQPYHQPTTLEEVKTLWIGDLQYWVDEAYLTSCFAHSGEVVSIKIIRNKLTGQPEGYGFVEFNSHAAAERVLQSYNGTQMPGTEQNFRLNWASFGIGERRPDAGLEHSIFVGDLAPDVTDYLLQETFRTQYPSVRGAKVVTDPNTGRSKGYGFVKFSDETEKNRAMTEMNGVFCSTRQMRISAATPKKTTGFQQQYAATKALYPVQAYATPPVQVPQADNDINNTTIFIGNLDPNVSEEELRQIFLHCGDIVYVKIPAGKGCGFIQFGTRASAEDAIQRMQGSTIGQQVVRISWGKSPTAKQDTPAWNQQVDPNQWSAYYGYGQGYEAYAYGATQDPSLYGYGAYAGYTQYPQQVDGVQDPTAMVASSVPAAEQREDLYDPLATPDVDKLNAAYLSVHGSAILGRPLWQKTSSVMQQT